MVLRREASLAAALLAASGACGKSVGDRAGAGGVVASGSAAGGGGGAPAGPPLAGRDGWCPNVLEWFDPGLTVCESYAVAFSGVGGVAGGGVAECAAPFDYEALGVDVVGLNHAVLAVDCEPMPSCRERDEQCWTFEFGDAPAITADNALCARIRDGEFDRLDFVPPCGVRDWE